MSHLKELLHTTPKFILTLEQNWIKTPKDFFEYFPRTYEDRWNIKLIKDLECDNRVTQIVKWTITNKSVLPRWNKKIYEIVFEDEEWDIWFATFFNTYYTYKSVVLDKTYLIIWKPEYKFWKVQFSHPDFIESEAEEIETEKSDKFWESLKNVETDTSVSDNNIKTQKKAFLWEDINKTGLLRASQWQKGIHPIYSELMWIKPTRFANKFLKTLDKVPQYFKEYLPQEFLTKYNLPDVITTIKNMHYPLTLTEQKKAVRRVFFDRLLRIQIHSIINKKEYIGKITEKSEKNLKNIRDEDEKEKNLWYVENKNISNTSSEPLSDFSDLSVVPERQIIKDFTSKLPFELTTAQKKVVKQIIEDFHSWQTMMRLLQWDVWSGKTIVAVIAIRYILQQFGWQIAFLAPLSVLSKQHFLSISKLLLPLWIHTELLSGELTTKQKEEVKQKLKTWQIQVIIWTHAIIQKTISFHDLKFVIIDEQHKFWVSQRWFLKNNQNPHILQMSATPIPRSMALAFFGEFEVSVIDEMPIWRKEIITKIVSEKDRKKLKPRISQKITSWQKLFVVAPLIEESEKMEEVQSATESFFDMQKLFPDIKHKIWLLHGRLSPKEKDEIMTNFKNWKIMILVSTTVIEVWVDIPEATIMIIKNAERFWLSQLHQLRWRIWRNDLQSYCFLETKKKQWDTYKRLKAMEETNDWFKLAELDLQNRGSGEILGHRQSWEWDIPFEILSDINFLEEIQTAAREILSQYPNLDWLPWLQEFVFEKAGKILI